MKPRSIRTTLSLDEDVASKLRAEARRSGKSFRTVVNETIRRGLVSAKAPEQEPYKVRSSPMGLRPGLSLDSISQLLEQIEGPPHK